MTDTSNTAVNFQKICAQLQIQRNQFADAHATAAARAETLAEELDRVKMERAHSDDDWRKQAIVRHEELERVRAEYCADRDRLHGDLNRQSATIHELNAKIAEFEKPKPEMLPVIHDYAEDCDEHD